MKPRNVVSGRPFVAWWFAAVVACRMAIASPDAPLPFGAPPLLQTPDALLSTSPAPPGGEAPNWGHERIASNVFGYADPFSSKRRGDFVFGPAWSANKIQRPHPAVARIVVSEGLATSYGSGTLVDLRDQYGLVITNWHVVRDAQGEIEVVFPDGFASKARPLKVDSEWDLAALVIWRPNAGPVKIAAAAPQPGDPLTICGYGQGNYRAAVGRCTKYYAPRLDFPEHMVELDVEARQGDSGGPIFNERGELAGVLFGAGQGTTLGSFCGRVDSFLASLAPDIGANCGAERAVAGSAQPAFEETFVAAAMLQDDTSPRARDAATLYVGRTREEADATRSDASSATTAAQQTAPASMRQAPNADGWQSADETLVQTSAANTTAAAAPARRVGWFDHFKSILAAVGVVAIVAHLLRAVR